MPGDLQIKITTNEGVTQTKEYPEWEVKSWANTLCEAEEIKADKEKMALLGPYLDTKAQSVKSIADLRKLTKQKIDRESQYQPDGYSSPDDPEEDGEPDATAVRA